MTPQSPFEVVPEIHPYWRVRVSSNSFKLLDKLKSALVTSRNFSELSTLGMDQLNMAPLLMELLESHNKLAKMIENMKTAMEKEGEIEAETSELTIHLTDFRSALESISSNVDLGATSRHG